MHVINLYAGPGVGKSSCAAALFSKMKWDGWEVELVTEYAKELVWEDRVKLLENAQPLILGEQFWRIKRLEGQVEVVICDSPLLLSVYYNRGRLLKLDDLAVELHNQFENFNVLLEPNPDRPYHQAGRQQTKDEALDAHHEIVRMLDHRKIEYLSYLSESCTAHQIMLDFSARP